MALALLAACTDADHANPSEATVVIETTACGHASATSGVGVVLEDGRILTTAHTVSGAGTVHVSGTESDATIVAYDPAADLAVIEAGVGLDGVHLTDAPVEVGDRLRLVRGSEETDVVDVSVLRRIDVRIDGVRTSEIVRRRGFEIDHRVELGDSGAGLFDESGGLVAVVYGRSTAGADRSFTVGVDAVKALLDRPAATYRCDPENHQIAPTG